MGSPAHWEEVKSIATQRGLNLQEEADTTETTLHLVIQKGRLFEQHFPKARIVLNKGRYLIVALTPNELRKLDTTDEPCFTIQPLPHNEAVFEQHPILAPAERSPPTPWIQDLVDRISQSQFESDLHHLVSYPTRFSTSQHYANAATWCEQQLQSLGYSTRTEPVRVQASSSKNVIAEKVGQGTAPRKIVLAVAHLDSINSQGTAQSIAPGADDNGSGSAGILQLARAFQHHSTVEDFRLILFGGEEQGLHGSRQYLANLSPAERERILCVINMDMIGGLNTPQPTVLLEGTPLAQSAMDGLAQAASTYSSLQVQTSLRPYASDHVPFIEAGIPAVLTIEGADRANPHIHTANDTEAHINADLAIRILKMNVGFLANQLKNPNPNSNNMKRPNSTQPQVTPTPMNSSRNQLSGRYHFNGGISNRTLNHTPTAFDDPAINLEEPVLLDAIDPPTPRTESIRFTLHIDIDGTDPLNVVSGTVESGVPSTPSAATPHFIGRVTANTATASGRRLEVGNFRFDWPEGSNDSIDTIEIDLTGPAVSPPMAHVTFQSTATGRSYGPYQLTQDSTYFREVEVEVDTEDGALNPEPYDTHTHPDRPTNLPQEHLTLENTFDKSGIRVTRSPNSNQINTSEAGINNRWDEQELHDAMESHWSRFANRPQWRMWIFNAELANSNNLGGIMFDADINEPGGVDRQGTALFTKSPFFHTAQGGFPQANPPASEAAQRELFFNLVHETGHAFNLAHSFHKEASTGPGSGPWTPPSWMPLVNDSRALSWMNYPDSASPGLNATWFYDRFRFRFDDGENLFLRHAPARFSRMGDSAWFFNHGRASRGQLDRRLELTVRTLKTKFDLGEPVTVELRLKNVSNEPVSILSDLALSDGYLQIAITTPNGDRKPLLPLTRARCLEEKAVLNPGDAIYEAVNVTIGTFGMPFKNPGPYRIEAAYHNHDGGEASAVTQLWVRPPTNYDDISTINELFNARIGRVIHFGGSRVMEDVHEKLSWICDRLGDNHPLNFTRSLVRAEPFSKPYKHLAGDAEAIRLLEPNPPEVERELAPLVEQPDVAADTLGHINYRRLIDTYTDCAVASRKKSRARTAQNNLLELFKQRNVLDSVVKEVEQKAKQLK